MSKTKRKLAQWLGVYLEPGILDPSDLTPKNILNNEDGWGLDAEALEEIHAALISIQKDERAQEAHRLACKLASAIEKELWGKRTNGKAKLKVIYGKI